MKAPAVDYVRPRSLAEAVDVLAGTGAEARVIAGGQSLVAIMNLRVASPGLLIDISRLPELSSASDDAETVTLGSCVTHAAIEDARVADPSRGRRSRGRSRRGGRCRSGRPRPGRRVGSDRARPSLGGALRTAAKLSCRSRGKARAEVAGRKCRWVASPLRRRPRTRW